MKRSLIILVLMAAGLGAVDAQDVKREVTRVTDDVYRFQNRFHMNMFVITGDGVVVTDPINEEAATWLKAEIAKLTDQPITHLVYSHSHGDHASGGTGYGEVPNVFMQQNAPEDIDLVEATIRFSEQMSFVVGSKTFDDSRNGGYSGDLRPNVWCTSCAGAPQPLATIKCPMAP